MSSDSCSVPPEFQAVILALDTDSPVPYATGTSSPKPLLPVMNQPLVLYQIRTLANHGFSSCIIVLCQSVFLSVSTILADRTYVDGFQVELVAVPDHTGTADALRIIRNKINTDFLVISGDLITDVQLHYLADFHRINDATVSVLMYKSPEASSSGDKGANVSGGKKKGKKKESTSSQVDPMKDSPFGGKDDLDRYHTSIIRKENALVYFKSSADIEYDGTLSLSKNLLRRVGRLTLRTDLRPAQCNLFAHWVLDFLERFPSISSIQAELVPMLVSLQFEENIPDLKSIFKEPFLKNKLPYELTSSSANTATRDMIRCYAYVAPESSFCFRINSLSSYFHTNMKLPFLPTSPHSPWGSDASSNASGALSKANPNISLKSCQVAVDGVTIGDHSKLKNCIIGRNCRIGTNVEMERCVLMDNVTVEDGAILSNSLLCQNSTIGFKAEIIHSCIGLDVSVAPEASIANGVV